MKNIIMGLLLGFTLHKIAVASYSYLWWNAEDICRLDKRFENGNFTCIEEKMDKWTYLKITILTPAYTFQKWELRY